MGVIRLGHRYPEPMLRRTMLAALALTLPACNSSQAERTASRFDAQRAWEHLEAQVALGPRHPDSQANRDLRDYIVRHLESCGLKAVREPFRVAETPRGEMAFENVYADLAPPGSKGGEPIVILASHFDTKILGPKFVGANDGGSSTAVLLELARVLAAEPPAGLVLRFLFLDGEEALGEHWVDPDNRYGSRWHAARLKEDAQLFPRVKAFVLLDLVGDADLKLTTDSYSTRSLLELFFEAARKNGLGQYVGGTRRQVLDDHLSFRQYNIDAVDLIDLDYGPDNDWWHSDEDTLEKCSKESLDAVGRLVLLGIPRLEARYAKSAGD
jgi:hypothetical protein